MVILGNENDISSWMELVNEVSWNFPGLETEDDICEHKKTVLKFMKEQRVLCVKDGNKVIGILLFSKKHSMICCLAVHPDYRNRGLGSELLAAALNILEKIKILRCQLLEKVMRKERLLEHYIKNLVLLKMN